MRPNLLVVLALTALVAGCGSPSQEPNLGMAAVPPGDIGALPAAAAHPGLIPVRFDVAISTPGAHDGILAGYDEVGCVAQPGVCELTGHEMVYFAENHTFSGSILDTGHVHAEADGKLYGHGTFVFTGSIAGCAGAGTVTWAYALLVDRVEPRSDGYVLHGWDNITGLVGFTGFAGVVDGRPVGSTESIFSAEYWLNPEAEGIGNIGGTLWCVPGPSGVHKVAIDVPFTSPGTQAATIVDGLVCHPAPPQGCGVELHEAIIPADASVLDGSFLDTAHVVGPSLAGTWVYTGSIAGCSGTGQFTLHWIAELDESSPLAANTNGEVVHGHDYLMDPSASTGLNIVGGAIDAEYDISPVTYSIHEGTLAGYLLCT